MKKSKSINQEKPYQPSEKKIVSTTLQKLRNLIKFTEKYETLNTQIQKVKQDKQCTQDPKQILNLNRLIEELEQKQKLMDEEKQSQKFDFEDIKIQMTKIDEIVDSIEPLVPSEQNEKLIHKQLKNLNRFEEHLLIIKTKTSKLELKQMIAQVMKKVISKKQEVIHMIIKQGQPINEESQLLNQQKQEFDYYYQYYWKKQFQEKDQQGCQFKNKFIQKFAKPQDETPTDQPIEEDKLLQLKQEIKEEKNQNNVKMKNEETPTALPDDQIILKDKPSLNQIQNIQKNIDKSAKEKQQSSEELQEHEKCQICLDKRRKYVAIPCGHFLYCEDCKELVTNKLQCLVCLQNVYQMVQVFQ